MSNTVIASPPQPSSPAALEALISELARLGRREAVELLSGQDDATVAAALSGINSGVAQELLAAFSPQRRQHVFAAAHPDARQRWLLNGHYPEGSVGRMMDPAIGLFQKDATVAEATEQVRQLVQRAFITYGFVVDEDGRLIGVLVMRDLLLASREATLESVMLRDPFHLDAHLPLMDAMKAVLNKHFPVYPVCEGGRLVGLIRGQAMFEKQAIELSAQAGSMVGVDKEERLSTPWPRSLKFRHPWLQLNLLTAFIAAAVVGVFQETIDRMVLLAVFLPVLAGQSGNTGCQALAVALRAMTLGELKPGNGRTALFKEMILGTANGLLVGLTAAVAMYGVALAQGAEQPMRLAAIVVLAMVGSCVLSGVSGVVVPIVLRRLGADPATASSIFLTTTTDVASMGMFLGLATVML